MSTTSEFQNPPRAWPLWLGATLSLCVGACVYAICACSVDRDAAERFATQSKAAQSVVVARIKSYVDLLRTSAAYVGSAEEMDHAHFHAFVEQLGLAHHFPAVSTLNYAPVVTDEGREIFERRIQHELRGVPGVRGALTIRPGSGRGWYLPVVYVEPDSARAGNGLVDLLELPDIFAAQLERARDTGAVHAAGTPIPVLSKPNDAHLGIRIPIYHGVGAPLSVEQRRARYRGSLGIAFSLPRLLHGAIDEMGIPGVRVSLFDVGKFEPMLSEPMDGPRIRYDSRGTVENPEPPLDTGPEYCMATYPLDFYGRDWTAVFSVKRSVYYTDFDKSYPALMGMFAFSACMLVFALVRTLATSRRAALALARDMTRELRDSQSKLQQSHRKLRFAADRAYQVKEQERKRIAREIHDDLGQSLVVLRLEAETLTNRTRGSHGYLHARLKAALSQIDVTIRSVRQIINGLRPTVLDLGLSAAVEWQVEQFKRNTGIVCRLHDIADDLQVTDHCATAIFRILQESLTNVMRHADATEVDVELAVHGASLYLSVRDNGCGMPAQADHKTGSFGLVGIEERVLLLGGNMFIDSAPGAGTCISVSVPTVSPPETIAAESRYESTADIM